MEKGETRGTERVVKWEETKNRVMNHCNSSSRCLLQFYFTLWSYYLLPTTHHCDRKFQVLSKNSLFSGLLLVKYICMYLRLGLFEMPILKAFYGRNYLYSSKPFFNFEYDFPLIYKPKISKIYGKNSDHSAMLCRQSCLFYYPGWIKEVHAKHTRSKHI